MKRIALLSLAIASTLHADTVNPFEVLTPIDTQPSTTALGRTFGADVVMQLVQYATSPDPNFDLGVQLRAIRALPLYCVQCDDLSAPYTTLVGLLQSYPSAPTSHDTLRLRATIEAFGALKSPDASANYTFLLPFLNNSSRDIRATTATALGSLCALSARKPLQTRSGAESGPGGSQQVVIAISAALRDLDSCALPH